MEHLGNLGEPRGVERARTALAEMRRNQTLSKRCARSCRTSQALRWEVKAPSVPGRAVRPPARDW